MNDLETRMLMKKQKCESQERNSRLGTAVAAAALLLAAACGTEAGNPGPVPPAASPVNQRSAASTSILNAMCAKLNECFPSLSVSACQSGVLPVTNIAPSLGLSAGFGSYQAIIDAEAAGTIQAKAPQSTACPGEVGALACGDASVTSAYDPAAPADFSGVRNL